MDQWMCLASDELTNFYKNSCSRNSCDCIVVEFVE